MATVEECKQALENMASTIAKKSGGQPAGFERAISVIIPDLGTGFHTTLSDGQLSAIEEGENDDAPITLTVASDDLVALSAGQLNAMSAWAAGKLKIDASFGDLLKLRSIL